MKNKAHDLSNYTFSAGEPILIDANIWLYLFPPPSGNSQTTFVTKYSKHFARLLQDGAKPILDPFVLSEYLNCYCRIEWKGKFKKNYEEFKLFRTSTDFATVGQTAALFAHKILTMCDRHAMPSNQLNIQHALADFAAGNIDFNDAILTDICKTQGYKLLTNDADFLSGGIEILTTNPKLLSACL